MLNVVLEQSLAISVMLNVVLEQSLAISVMLNVILGQSLAISVMLNVILGQSLAISVYYRIIYNNLSYDNLFSLENHPPGCRCPSNVASQSVTSSQRECYVTLLSFGDVIDDVIVHFYVFYLFVHLIHCCRLLVGAVLLFYRMRYTADISLVKASFGTADER